MNDDWRLRIDLHDQGFAHRLGELLEAEELEHDLKRSFHDRVVVSVDGPEVFCYTGTRDQAEAAEKLIGRLAQEQGWTVRAQLRHWHPTAERWEDPDAPLPTEGAGAAEERADRSAQERAESAEQGYPEFEVRIRCDGRSQAGELSDRLSHQDIPNLHRWNYVLVGATDEDSARALAQWLTGEVPAKATITVERNPRAIYDELPRSPFSVLGGLGG
jgi:hypothetical protein